MTKKIFFFFLVENLFYVKTKQKQKPRRKLPLKIPRRNRVKTLSVMPLSSTTTNTLEVKAFWSSKLFP